MTRAIKPLLAAASVLALSACGDSPILASFYQEAGVTLTQLGDSTANNVAVQSGEKNYVIDLNRRFTSEVQSTVTFPFNSSALDADAQAVLRVQANWIRQFPEVRFKVYGHADAVGTNAYNKRLGLRRAHTVVNFLVAHGVERSRLQAVVSFGEERPVIVTQQRERLNRRAVTEVSGFVQSHPAVLNGKYAEVVFREYVESATEMPPDSRSGLAAIAAQGG